MKTITIRNVPEETHAELAARAARAGQSLQEYLKRQLVEMARRADINEWLERVRANKRGITANITVEDILAARDADRK